MWVVENRPTTTAPNNLKRNPPYMNRDHLILEFSGRHKRNGPHSRRARRYTYTYTNNIYIIYIYIIRGGVSGFDSRTRTSQSRLQVQEQIHRLPEAIESKTNNQSNSPQLGVLGSAFVGHPTVLLRILLYEIYRG